MKKEKINENKEPWAITKWNELMEKGKDNWDENDWESYNYIKNINAEFDYYDAQESLKITESVDYGDERLQELINNIKLDLDDEDITVDVPLEPDEDETIVNVEVYTGSGEYVGSWELDLDLYDDISYASSIADEINAVDLDDEEGYDGGYGRSISHRDVSRWTSGNYYGEDTKNEASDGLSDHERIKKYGLNSDGMPSHIGNGGIPYEDDWVEPELGEFVEEYKGFNIYKGTDSYGDEIYRCFFVDDADPEPGYEEWEEGNIKTLEEWIDSYEDFDEDDWEYDEDDEFPFK